MSYLDLPEDQLIEERPATKPLAGRTIVLGVCGSIASNKSVSVASALVQAGAKVNVAVTSEAGNFVGPWAYRGLTNNDPYTELFEPPEGIRGEPHIELARHADFMVIYPASAACLSRLANGEPCDPVSLTAMNVGYDKLIVLPAMSDKMWKNPAVKRNVAWLREQGVAFIGPIRGRLASGDIGEGRIVEPQVAMPLIQAYSGRRFGDLRGVSIVVSAYGCREDLDGVRILTNKSSGKQGHALAEAARDRGALVHLVTGDERYLALGYEHVSRYTDHASLSAILTSACVDAHCYIGAAAVADFTPKEKSAKKIKREKGQNLLLELVPTADILGGLPSMPELFKVAFAAETNDHRQNAQRKLKKKGAELIVLNDVTRADAGFSVPVNRVLVFAKDGGEAMYPKEGEPSLHKYDVACRILDHVRDGLFTTPVVKNVTSA